MSKPGSDRRIDYIEFNVGDMLALGRKKRCRSERVSDVEPFAIPIQLAAKLRLFNDQSGPGPNRERHLHETRSITYY